LLSAAGAEVFLENGGEQDILASGNPRNCPFGRELAVLMAFGGLFAYCFDGAA
jgi:hypothetical protein